MDKDIAIKVEHLSKTFRIPHEKVSSVRGAFVGMFKGKRTYEEFKALDDVSFEVKKGEFFGIIGRNGSGKSTLLKILAGIYQPDKGKTHIDGMISPFLELGIGFNPELSGRDNVYLNATVLGMTKKQIDEKFDSIVAFSELERFIDQKLKNYSSGMQVRLAFSVSIHANRDILLMDEVLAVGDSNFQSKCLEEFVKYKEIGKTVVLVSHDIGTVQRYCDRVIFLRSGKVIEIGKSEEVVDKYINYNIADEEKRMNSDLACGSKKNYPEEEKENKSISINRVEFLNSDGERKNIFESGEDVSIRVYFDVSGNKSDLNFGIALHNQENDYILGINTIFDKIDTKESVDRGYFQVDYKNIPLNTDAYYVAASIVKDNFSAPYDSLPKSQYFKIVAKNRNEGIVQMKYLWK